MTSDDGDASTGRRAFEPPTANATEPMIDPVDATPTEAGRSDLDDELIPLEARVLRLWRIRAGIAIGAVAVVALALVLALGGDARIGALVLLATAAFGWLAWMWTARVWRAWQFRIGDDALHLRHGVLTRVESTIPLHRVQHIDTQAGPLERRLGLTTLVLRTASAGSDATVPGIDASEATSIRERILALVGTDDAT